MAITISGSNCVKVYDVTMNFSYSDKVLFATLVTSRSTMKKGEKVWVEEKWKAKFIGNAFFSAQGLNNGDIIDISNGWITQESYKKNNVEHTDTYIIVNDFVVGITHTDNESS